MDAVERAEMPLLVVLQNEHQPIMIALEMFQLQTRSLKLTTKSVPLTSGENLPREAFADHY